jgi:hypothetical protein
VDLALSYAFVTAGYPLVSTVPIAFGLESRVVTVPYRALVLGLSLWSIWRSLERRELYRGALWLPLGMFWVLYLARMLSDTLLFPVPLGAPGGEYFLYGIGTTFIPMIALFARPTEATLRLALRLTVWMAAVSLVAVLYLGATTLLSGEVSGALLAGRFELFTLNSISLGHLGVSLTTLALVRLGTGEIRTLLGKLGLVGAALLGLVCAGVAASKGPLLALLVNLVCLLYLDYRQGHRVRALGAAFLAPLVGLPVVLYLDQLGFGSLSRFSEAMGDPSVESVSVRVDLLNRGWAQFLAHPILGSSLEERVMLAYPHNLVVESFMAVGIVGGLTYLTFHLVGLGRALRLVASRPSAAWVGILCFQYSVSALFSGSIYLAGTMWAMLAASIALTSGSEALHRRASTAPPLSQAIPT